MTRGSTAWGHISREAWSLLKRLQAREGPARNFNDVLARELVEGGYARITGEGLLPTAAGLASLATRPAPPL